MKKSISVLYFLLTVMFLFSQNQVSKELAEHVAINCLISKTPAEHAEKFIYHDIQSVETITLENIPVFHVVNIEPEGFVIVSATKTYHPVIAFSFTGQFEIPVKAPAVRMWLENEKNKILYSITHHINYEQISNIWAEYEHGDFLNLNKQNEKILLPMLTTQWNQGIYYNEFCPADAAGPDGKTYAGCVATAIGQVMNYFRYPLSGTGSYTSDYTTYGIHTVDYENTEYHWSEMPLKATRSNHPVAELLYHIGVSVDMNYGPNGSGMWNHKAAHTMKTFFGYTDSTQYNFRDTTTIDWYGMLIDHLDSGIVLYYAGWTDSQYVSGHAFVCDGYQDSTFFHFNWGWGGAYDGYFHIDNLIVGGSDFTTMHEAVINATPANNYPYFCNGTDTLRTLDGTIEDGSGPIHDHQNNAYCSWLILPDDTVSSITLDFIRFDLQDTNDVVRIYNGMDSNAPLLGAFTGNSTPNSIGATGNALFVQFETNGSGTSGGFLLSYSAQQVKTCSGLTTLTSLSGTISDGSGPYNYQNGNFCRWKIEPPGAQLINISFTEFDIDSTDYVRISNLSTGEIIASLAGTQIPDLLSIHTDKVQVMFMSNSTGNAGGFTLHYESFQQSIEELMNSHLNIYPNPASDLISISNDENMIPISEIQVSIFSLTGQLVSSVQTDVSSGEKNILISHLNEGFYILNIRDDNGNSVNKKIVISR